MKYAVEIGSGVKTYISGSGIQKLMGKHRDTQHGDRISPLSFVFFSK